jgi:hypothetical protein
MTTSEETSSLKLLSQHLLEDISDSFFTNHSSVKLEYTSSSSPSSEIDLDSYFSEHNSFLESLGFEADTKFIDFTSHDKVQNLKEERHFEETQKKKSNLAEPMVLDEKEKLP